MLAPYGHPVLRVRDRLRDSPTPHPCADGERCASCTSPFGSFPPALAAPQGPEQQRASFPHKHQHKQRQKRKSLRTAVCLCTHDCAQRTLASDLRAGSPSPFGAPAQRRATAGEPEGRRARCAPFFVGAWMHRRKIPSSRADPQRRMRGGRVARALSFGDLFFTTGLLPFALRASFAVSVAPATQSTRKEKSPGRFSGRNALDLDLASKQ